MREPSKVNDIISILKGQSSEKWGYLYKFAQVPRAEKEHKSTTQQNLLSFTLVIQDSFTSDDPRQ